MLAVLIAAVLAGTTRLPPVDQCANDASFVAFRSTLKTVVDRQDAGALMDLLDEKVLVDFGGSYGKQVFSSAWALNEPRTSELWGELREALRLGCAIQDGVFVSPSMGAQLDPDVDSYEVALAKPGAKALSRSGKTIRTLNWDLLMVTKWPSDTGPIEIRLPDGRTGYVRQEDVRTATDYRLTVEKRGGVWRITGFLSGD